MNLNVSPAERLICALWVFRVVLCGIAVSKWSQEAQNHNASIVDYNMS
jgi:hypothetical protein